MKSDSLSRNAHSYESLENYQPFPFQFLLLPCGSLIIERQLVVSTYLVFGQENTHVSTRNHDI